MATFVFSQDAHTKITYQDLRTVQDEINKLCPMDVDSETRLDNCIAFPAAEYNNWRMSLQYNYSLINRTKSSLGDDKIQQLKDYMQTTLTNNIKTSDDAEIFRYNNIILIYNYKDKNGEFLFKVKITPENYNKI